MLAAAAAGYASVAVCELDGNGPDLPGGLALSLAALDPLLPGLAPVRVVVLPANVVPQSSWLAAIDNAPFELETLCIDSSMTIVVDTADPRIVLESAKRCANPEALSAELRSIFTERAWPLHSLGRFPLFAAEDLARAETWLLRSLVKQRESFMSRHFERRISLALTRWMAPSRVTPNTMTIVSVAVGLGSAPFFLSSRPLWQLVGALLFLAHSILDGCDGELARLKFLQSRRGAVLDFWGDNLVHVAILSGIALGWSRTALSLWPLGLGILAVAATLSAAAVMFERTAHDRPTADDSAGGRALDALSGRDFIYVLVALSAFGKAAWFLVAVAVGTPLFLLAALWLERRRGRLR